MSRYHNCDGRNEPAYVSKPWHTQNQRSSHIHDYQSRISNYHTITAQLLRHNK